MATHDVFNTPPPWRDVNIFNADAALSGALGTYSVDDVEIKQLTALGELAGSEQAQEWGRLANAYPPVLRTHDRYGRRIDEVDFHPSWHALMGIAVGNGLHATPWRSSSPTAHVSRAARFFVWSQVEAGHGCPISMSYAIIPALRANDQLATAFEPLLCATQYDFGLKVPTAKSGLLAGMAMTEKQGGSDVRANTTRAVPAGDGSYLFTGHKWFCSAPMCDVFLVLAQAATGLSCFLVPRVLPDGTRNPFLLQRLKDKLGNRSNASAEVEFDQTRGWLVGDEGDGIRTILDMVTMTRIDCVIGSASGQRAALTQAIHHVRHRRAFGTLLFDAPLMREVLADLATESEAAMALALRLAHAVDAGEQDFLRLAVAAAKFWVCKRTPTVVGEALECLGGNGYVEESGMPRLFRESPLNSIWEGSGNVIALDVLRAVRRDPATVEAVLHELSTTAGADPAQDANVERLRRRLTDSGPSDARGLATSLARCQQGSLLIRTGSPAVPRFLAGPWAVAGESAGANTDLILERCLT